jgi:hypothetical protein
VRRPVRAEAAGTPCSVAVSIGEVRVGIGGRSRPNGIGGPGDIAADDGKVGRSEGRGITNDQVSTRADQHAIAVIGDVISVNPVAAAGGADARVRAGQGTETDALVSDDHRIAKDLDAIEAVAADHAITDEARAG